MQMKTSLIEWHRAHQARLVEFAGWEMPIQYTTIVEEHHAVRREAGLFDISHMGRLYIRGGDAESFLNWVVTIDVSRLSPGRIRYALATNEQGGIRDDVLVYRLENEFLVVVNASNREKIVEFWNTQSQKFSDVQIDDQTLETSMIAVQGPKAVDIIRQDFPQAADLKYYHSVQESGQGGDFLISRTGYTGEDGFEFIGSPDEINAIWSHFYEQNQPTLQACGLGCRDTLRLEAGMPLYGHELSETIDPLSAGLKFAVSLKKDSFLGQKQIVAKSEEGLEKQRVGLELEGRRIAREGATVETADGQTIGEVTSGTFSPTLEKSIAMAYVPSQSAVIGTKLLINIRGKTHPAIVTSLPFYQRSPVTG
ncbi:MAG TPA: glycine cleavage system aminomethyltransferase GcvT [Planctomycetaceae bacterium]|nr:glycine cleavage system aminomethyltransferase GcvT [Planctomycetaceae bacterium]